MRELSKRAEALYSPDGGKTSAIITDPHTGEIAAKSVSNRRLKCGRVRRSSVVKLMYDQASGAAWFDGVVMCRNMSCPVCSWIRLAAYGAVIEDAVDRWEDAGAGRCFLLTLTGQHDRDTDTAALWSAMTDAWTDANTGRESQEFRALVGIVDWCKRVEITDSRKNGFHPHLHILIMFREKPGWRRLRWVMRRYWAAWRDGLAARGFKTLLRVPAGRNKDAGKLLGIKITNADRAGAYLTKMGFGRKLALELTNTAAKESKIYETDDAEPVVYVSRSLHRVLLDYGETGSPADGRRWVEGNEIQRGRRVIDWSRALRRTFRVPLQRRPLRFGVEGPTWAPTREDTRAIAECLAERCGTFRDWQPAFDSKGLWKGWNAQRVHSRELFKTVEIEDQGKPAAQVIKQYPPDEWDSGFGFNEERQLADIENAETLADPELPAEWAVRQAWALGKTGHSHLEGDHERTRTLPRVTPIRLPDEEPIPLTPADRATRAETRDVVKAMERWGMSLEEVIEFGTGRTARGPN